MRDIGIEIMGFAIYADFIANLNITLVFKEKSAILSHGRVQDTLLFITTNWSCQRQIYKRLRTISELVDDSSILKEGDELQYWHRISQGDIETYEYVFKSYYSDLYGYGLKLCGRPELVKDVIQELFVMIWERRGQLDTIYSLKVYLMVSLRRQILKTLYRERREIEILNNQNDVPEIHFTAEEIIIRDESLEERRKELQDALNSLPPRQKEVIYLRFYNGMSYEEIEEILSINYQSIRNHVHRAIKNLREILQENMPKIVALSLLGFFLS